MESASIIPFPASLPWGESRAAEWLSRIPESGEMLIVLPVEPQPKKSGSWHWWNDVGWRGPESFMMRNWCHYPAGSTLAVTIPYEVKERSQLFSETIWIGLTENRPFCITRTCTSDPSPGEYAASTMPEWLRQHFRLPELFVTDVKCRKVASIDDPQSGATRIDRVELSPGPFLGESKLLGNQYGHPMTSTYAEAFQRMWQSAHPDCPFDVAWAWFITVRREG